VNAFVTSTPARSTSSKLRSAALVRRYERPTRQLALSPMSSPTCANAANEFAPFLLRSVPGNDAPRPDSMPSSMKRSAGASHFS
jgi:hypothetical protein